MQTPAGIITTANQLPSGSRNGSRNQFATACLALPAVLALATTGCKSGSSMGNSWWAFGMGGPDPAALAEAPPFEGDLTKPSATATPYPTTSTPESYALAAGDTPAASQPPPAAGSLAKTTQPPVTYGTTPPPAAATPAQPPMTPAAPGATAVAANSPEPGMGPQVGPYQTIPATGSPAATAATPSPATFGNRTEADPLLPQPSSRFASQPSPGGLAGAPPAAPPAGSRFSSVASQRVAEAPAAGSYAGGGSRFSSPPAATAPVAPMLPDRNVTPAISESRYGQAPGSAFSAGGPAEQTPPAGGFPRGPAQPAEFPGASQFPGATADEPIAPAGSPQLPAPPPSSRRRDPGYRPGGTSSYRAAEPVYAERGAPAAPSGPPPLSANDVKPASFETQLSPAGLQPQALPAGIPAVSGPPSTSP